MMDEYEYGSLVDEGVDALTRAGEELPHLPRLWLLVYIELYLGKLYIPYTLE